MKAICGIAERNGSWVIADEVYRGAELDARESRSFWGLLRPLAGGVRAQQGLRAAGAAHRLGGGTE